MRARGHDREAMLARDVAEGDAHASELAARRAEIRERRRGDLDLRLQHLALNRVGEFRLAGRKELVRPAARSVALCGIVNEIFLLDSEAVFRIHLVSPGAREDDFDSNGFVCGNAPVARSHWGDIAASSRD